ncbi:FecCD family ABC transporter permease [Flavonifractor plautii]|uniref:FecCD family ABC transporter permease n=1 Tax=Flavonifractor plautii TaxID=292800 RepID=UPI003D7D102C
MRRKRACLIQFILVLGLIATVLLSLNSGYSQIGLADLWGAITGTAEKTSTLILLKMRLPRIILAVLCGMGLALSGCTLQAVTDNSLADPGIIGINAGAGFSVMIFMWMFPSLHIDTKFYRPLFAMMGGLLTAFFLYNFAKRDGRIRPAHFLLGGIGASAGFTSMMTILGTNINSSIYQMVQRWLVGNIWGTDWYQIKILLPCLLVLVPLLFWRVNVLDLLLLGEDSASALGVRVGQERRVLLFLSAVLAASCVSVSGGIGFIGLVAPHIARRITGVRHRNLLLTSMLTGGILLVLADTVGRVLLSGIEVPAGIVISILAAPYFLYLLHKQI